MNRDPIAGRDLADVGRGRSVVIAVLTNDSDPDGGELLVSDITRMPSEGTVTVNPDGTITYTHNGTMPAPGIGHPYSDTFEYEIEDPRSSTARAEVSVNIFPSFDDVPEDNIFAEDIEWLAVWQITRGCNPPENTLFCPGELVTRGQMAAFLVRARFYSDGAGADLFVDDDGSTFETVIDQLGTAGVTRGCNPPINDRYCPTGYVTRGQMAAFLARAFRLTDPIVGNLFADDDGSIFEADIDKLGAHGVSRGCNPPQNNHFCPNDYVTRQQMAAFIRRAQATDEE